VGEHGLPGFEAAVLEQCLPRGQSGDRQAGGDREVDVARERREVAASIATYSARVPLRCAVWVS
jgi:hypothetical protein